MCMGIEAISRSHVMKLKSIKNSIPPRLFIMLLPHSNQDTNAEQQIFHNFTAFQLIIHHDHQ